MSKVDHLRKITKLSKFFFAKLTSGQYDILNSAFCLHTIGDILWRSSLSLSHFEVLLFFCFQKKIEYFIFLFVFFFVERYLFSLFVLCRLIWFPACDWLIDLEMTHFMRQFFYVERLERFFLHILDFSERFFRIFLFLLSNIWDFRSFLF